MTTTAKFEAGKTYFRTWNEDTGHPHMTHYTVEKRTPKTVVLKSGARCRIGTHDDGVEFIKVGYNLYVYADSVCTVEAENRQAEQDKAWDKMEADIKDNTVDTNTEDNTEAELIKHNGVSFEGFLATNAGLTIEEYRARKAAQQAAEQAEAERRTKIFNLKDGIASTEYKINETSGTLNDIIKNHYRPESDDGSWDEYTAELGDTLATAVSTLNTLKAQLAELEPAIVEDNTTESNIEVIAETDTAQVEDNTDNTTEDNVEAEDATDDEPTDTADDTPEPPVDDFTAELAKLEAERDAADKRVSKLNNDLLEAQKAADKASNALYKFGDAKARELARNHLPALGFSKTTAVITQDGDAIDAPNLRHIRIDFNFRKFKFEIVADWTTFGTYDTPEQVKSVIAGLKTAIRHEEKFTFPTAEALTAPTKPEPPKVEHTPDDEDGVWTIPNKLTKKLSSIPRSTLLEVITQDGEQIFTYIAGANIEPRWGDIDRFAFVSNNHDIAVYDTPEQIEDVINLIKSTIERGEEKFTFPTVKGLTAPDIDNKDNLRGSLKRAAEIARKKYHEYEREGDNDGMLYEIELYSICADAIKELEAA